VVGSITHCDGYRAAAVALATEVAAIGIDAEPHDPLPAGILDRVTLPADALGDPLPGVHWDGSVQRQAYRPGSAAQRWLGFEEALLFARTGPERGTFIADLLVGPLPVVAGRRCGLQPGRGVRGLLGTRDHPGRRPRRGGPVAG
jgi:4'-phosphopantetheinyl transferase EntD